VLEGGIVMKSTSQTTALACAAVFLLVGLISAAPALGQAESENVVEWWDVPVGAHLYNECTGEWIDVAGSLRSRYHLTQTPSGRVIEHITYEAGHLDGVVPATGEHYEVIGTDVFAYVANSDYMGQQGTLWQYSWRLIQKGSGGATVKSCGSRFHDQAAFFRCLISIRSC
jgi:hypothetical protein